MKRILLLIVGFSITLMLNAQVSKTLNVSAGGLFSALTPTELSTVTNLIITGTIDARDFKTMRDNMPVLANIDLSGSTQHSAICFFQPRYFYCQNQLKSNHVPFINNVCRNLCFSQLYRPAWYYYSRIGYYNRRLCIQWLQ